jgi:hypothetical protein
MPNMDSNENTRKFVELMDFNLEFCGPSNPAKNRQGLLAMELIRCHSVKTADLSSAEEDHKKFIRCLCTYMKMLDFFVKTDSLKHHDDKIHHFGPDKSQRCTEACTLSLERQLDQADIDLELLEFTLAHITDDCTRAKVSTQTTCHDFSIDNTYQLLISELNNRYRFLFPFPPSKAEKSQQRGFLQDLMFTAFEVQAEVSSHILNEVEAEFKIRLVALQFELCRLYQSTFTSEVVKRAGFGDSGGV